MNATDSLKLSQALNYPIKSLQKLSLSQTSQLEKWTSCIPIYFHHGVQNDKNGHALIACLESSYICVKDTECHIHKLVSSLFKYGIIDENPQISSEQNKKHIISLLCDILTPSGHGTLVNIPLLVTLYTYWYKNKQCLSSSSSSSSSSYHVSMSSFNTTLETLRLSGYSELLSYLLPIIGERLSSTLKEDDLKGIGLVFDTLLVRLQDIGLDFSSNQEKLYTLLAMLKTGGFTIESSSSTCRPNESRIDIIRLLKFCKEYLKRKESLTVISDTSLVSVPQVEYQGMERLSISDTLTRNSTAWSNKKPLQKMVTSNQLADHIKTVNGFMISSEAEGTQQRRHNLYHHKDVHDKENQEMNALLHQQQLELDLKNRKEKMKQLSPFKVIKPWMKTRDHRSPEKRHSKIDGTHSSVDYNITIPDPVSPSKLTDLVGMKVPEKRHIPSPLRLSSSIATVTTSNVYYRLKRILPSLLDIEIKKFYYSLCKSAIASGSFLTKSALLTCLLDIGIKITHYDSELLWEDLTYGGRRLSITPEQCLDQLGVSLSESTIIEIQNSLNSIREQDQMMKIMQSSPLRQNVGYDENDIAMLRLVQQDDEMRKDIYSKLSSPSSHSRDGTAIINSNSSRYTSPTKNKMPDNTWKTQDENSHIMVPETNNENLSYIHDHPPPLPLPSSNIHGSPRISSSSQSSTIPPSIPLDSRSSASLQQVNPESKIYHAISILSTKKIELALLYRRWGGSTLGCRGNMLVDILLSPSLSLGLTREEIITLVCEAGNNSIITDPSRFEVSYAQLLSYIDKRKNEYGVIDKNEKQLIDSIKEKLILSREIQGKKDNLISRGHSLRIRLRSMQNKYVPNNGMSRDSNLSYMSRSVDNEDINSAEIQALFRWIDVNFTHNEVLYIKKCLSDEPQQWKDRRHAEEGRINFNKLIMFLVETFLIN